MIEENNNTSWEAEEESSIKFVDLWHMVWDYKWWYVLAVFVCLSLAAVKIYRSHPVYSLTAKVIIDDGSQEAMTRELSSFTGGLSRFRYSINVDNEVEAFASPDLMLTVVDRLGLETSYFEHQLFRRVELCNPPFVFTPAGDNPLSSFSFDVTPLSEGGFEIHDFVLGADASAGRPKPVKIKNVAVRGAYGDTLSTAVGRIVLTDMGTCLSSSKAKARDITVKWVNTKAVSKVYCSKLSAEVSGKQTSVIVLTLRDCFPSRADNVLSTLIDVYNEVWISNKNRSAINTTNFINDRLVVIEKELGCIESDLKDYKSRNNLTDLKALSNLYLTQSSEYAAKDFEVSNQLAVAEYIKEYLANPANATEMIPANSGINSVSIEKQIADYNELILSRDRLLSNSSENNPMVSDVTNALASIRSAILRSIDNLIVSLGLQAEQIESQEHRVRQKISSSSGQEMQLLAIQRQQKVKESLYVYLLQKREENEIASLVNVGNTRLIMTPNHNGAPVAPRKTFIILFALLAGFFIPFLVIFFRRVFNNTVSSKEDIERYLTIPFLAEIPELQAKGRKRLNRKKAMLNDDNRRVFVESGNRNAINEAFRVLRTNVDMMLNPIGGSKVVMMTSFNVGSGKTFVSLNLAASMAVKDARVLVIDLDMRKASLSMALGGNNTGVASWLNGKTDDLHACIQNIASNLDALKVGSLPPNPTELLLSEKFSCMLDILKADYDYIFLDCPPIDVVADSSIISAYADMSIFIVRAGLMDMRVLPRFEELYRNNKYNRMAIILNGVDQMAKRYGHYGSYGYGSYGYGSYGYGNTDDN